MNDPLIGKQLDEYILEKLLGQGGMARVYRGLDTGLQRYAAIKVIDTPHQRDESYIARFEREALAIAQLDHPHIVTVYRYGRVGQLLYLAMKYIEGADLQAILNGFEQDKEFMDFDDVTRLLREIGAAVDYAHSQGVIHRDIKPSNVMLDAHGQAYLTDFGLALLTEQGTQGEILGSPKYIAPEQAISSADAVNQSDVYALGVILYRMSRLSTRIRWG
jgi:serine/threonine protein kinase